MAFFGGNKPDHPMADIKEAKKLISELPANDSSKALDEATFWLDSLSHTDGLKLDYRYELFDLLDQSTRIHQRRVGHEYLATDRNEKFREHKLWNTLFEFWKMLGAAYGDCVDQSEAGVGGDSTIKRELPVIVARAMRMLALQLKWILLRYGPLDHRVWAEIGRLYLLAERRGVTNEAVEIYPDNPGCVRDEFLKAMMLGASSTDGLTPIKQQIVERIVAHFGSMFTLESSPAPGCNYFFDLSTPEPAARVQNNLEPKPTMRFFGAGKALPALEQLMLEVNAKRDVPPDVNLGGTFDTDLVFSAMQHLALYWSENRPVRNSERRAIVTRLTVVHGFRNVLRCVTPNADHTSLDFQNPEGGESWIVENISEGGFGAIVAQVKSDQLRIGGLLGVQAETAPFWGAGVVRRITRDEYEQFRVGIRLLSKTIIPVNLSPAGDVSSFNAAREGEPAVLLSTTPNASGEVALLLREGSFTRGQPLAMEVRGKHYLLAAGELLEAGDDFDWAKFKVIRKQ